MERVLDAGDVVEVNDSMIPLTRYGFTEEAYFTFTFSPLRDEEGRISGILQIVTERTSAVLSERRERRLHALSAANPLSDHWLTNIATALSSNDKDIPFFSLYLWNESRQQLEEAIRPGGESMPRKDTPYAVARAFSLRTPVFVEKGAELCGDLGPSVWPEPVQSLYCVPVQRSSDEQVKGVVVLGISPRLQFDKQYRAYCDSIAHEIAAKLPIIEDVSSRKWHEIRKAFLEEATAELLSSLDYEHTLNAVADRAVSELADSCSIEVIGLNNRPGRVLSAHSDPSAEALAEELRIQHPADPDGTARLV
jgi:hypothetical protein